MMRRGEIWVARLNPNTGSEIGKVRPVLILLAQRYIDAGSPVILAAPLTTQYWPGMAALRYQVSPRERLLKDSFVVLEQMRALDRGRFGDTRLAELTVDEMWDIDRQMMVMFGMIIPSH
ncbi:MAG: type II toxin-antitoxin system PemK/MazF family toxin [Pseudomonadota bacterium]|nr:type II toxin-antitoxin system PemK/MazF family toxin [Pseudomonadota bacterium]